MAATDRHDAGSFARLGVSAGSSSQVVMTDPRAVSLATQDRRATASAIVTERW